MDTAKKLEEIVEQLRQGDWNLRAPQELADLLAETITTLSTPAAADAPEPVALTERFDRQAVTNLIAAERVELLEAKYTGKGFDADRLAELDAALMALWPRVTPEMRAALAASQPAPVEENVLDLVKAFWEQLMQAAGESEWIPQEHYYVNDWVADCCNFLRTGSSISAPVSVPEVEIPEGLQCNVCDGEPGLRVLGSRAWTACSVCHGSGRTDVLGPYVPGTSRKKVDAAPTPSKGEAT